MVETIRTQRMEYKKNDFYANSRNYLVSYYLPDVGVQCQKQNLWCLSVCKAADYLGIAEAIPKSHPTS